MKYFALAAIVCAIGYFVLKNDEKSDYRKGIYVDVDSFLLVFFKDERIRLIFTILWHTYRKRVLGKGIKRNGTPVSKCISTGRELVCVDSELPWDVKKLREICFLLLKYVKRPLFL